MISGNVGFQPTYVPVASGDREREKRNFQWGLDGYSHARMYVHIIHSSSKSQIDVAGLSDTR